MNRTKFFVKKLTALVLCLCMVLPMVTTGFAPLMALLDGITPEADAAVTEKGTVAFYVPEVIYLYPSLTSWSAATSTPFQYYIQNTVNTSSIYTQPTPNTDKATTGTIYFAAADGFSDVSISQRFVDANGVALTGGSITVGAFSNQTSYGTFSITAGTSPSFAASTTGCYIEWTVSYTNNAGERQSAIAYSYVYKPYTIPYGAALRVENTDGVGATYHGFAQSLSWVSGVHSITAAGNRYARFQPVSSGASFAPFLSDNAIGYNGSTALTGTLTQLTAADTFNSGSRRMYAVFATTDTSTSYFKANQTNNGISNEGVGGWLSESNSGTYNIATITYDNYSAGDNFIYMQKEVASKGNIYIDTSRYTNLNQVPNLGVGLLVTDDENTDDNSGSWYVADATGQSNLGNYSTTSSDNGNAYYRSKGTVMAGQGDSCSGSGNEREGIKYAGAWVCTLTDTASQSVSKTYTAKTYYGNQNDGEYQTEAAVMHLVATQQNKSTLRTAVDNAINAMGTLGLKDNYGSYYYDTNNAAWTAFKNAYRNAYVGLTKLDGAVDVSGLTSALNTAVANLKAGQGRKIFFDVNYNGINPNLYILGSVTDGGYGLTATYNADESVTLNGTITGANAFGTTPFTPAVGTYTFSSTLLSGTKTGDGCVVLDSADENANNVSTRTNFDFTGSTWANKTYSTATAKETDLLRFWVWMYNNNTVYDNFKVQIKVEKGTTQTAYSPAARVVNTTDGTYGALPTPTRTGYTFDGWYTEAACTNQVTSSSAVTVDTLYAKWTADPQTLTVDSNGGINTTNLLHHQQGLTSWSEGQESNVSANITIDESGVDITGNYTGGAAERVETLDLWVYLEDGKTYEYSFKASNTISEFYLFPNGEVGNHANIATHSGTDYSGVFTCGEAGGNIGESSWTNLTDATAYYQLRLDQNCGTSSDAVVTAYTISDFVIKEVDADATSKYIQPTDSSMTLLDPVRGGYEFDSWEFVGTQNGTLSGTTYTFGAGADTLKATWTVNTYTLTLDADGGTVDPTSISYTIEDSATLPAATKTGYNFLGWKVTATDGNWQIDGICQEGDAVTGMYGNTTLTAMWEEIEVDYKVEHYQMNLDGSTYSLVETEEKTGLTNSAAEFAAKTYEGFTYSEAKVGDTVVTAATVLADGSLVIKLYYTRNKYTVSAVAGTGISSVTGAGEYYYGASVTVGAVVKAGYAWANWQSDNTAAAADSASQSYTFTLGAGDVTLTASANPQTVNYTVIHRQENLSGVFETVATETLSAQVDTEVSPAVKSYVGFTAPAVQTATVNGDGSTTVTYDYSRNSYNFTVVVDGVSTITEYKYGASVTAPATPSKTGYTFAGWDGTVPAAMPADHVTVTATWTVNTYEIEYIVTRVDNGEVLHTYTVQYDYDAPVTDYVYTADGYSISAWTGEPETMPAQNITVTATATLIKYNISYTLNGGAVTTENPQEYYVTDAAITLNNPTKTGYEFAGWTGTDLTAATLNVTIAAGSTGDRSYTANWTAAANKYTVHTYTMDVNGNYGEAVVTTVTDKKTGDSVTLTPDSKTGFTVDAQSVLTGVVQADGSLVLSVYYKRNSYAVTLTAGTGIQSVAGAGTYYYDAPVNMTATLQNGYENVVWTDTAATVYTPGFLMPDKQVSLTANATAIGYTIAYELDGGSVSGSNPTSYNVETASFTLINPTKTGYDFAGWTGTGLDAASDAVTVAKGSVGNRSYTATWTPHVYKITYNYNDGTVATANPTEYTIESEAFTLTNPTKVGYAFAGWTGTGIDGAADSVTVDAGSTGDRTYTATWTESDANYTVKHYRQAIDGTYPESLLETETVASTTNKTETAATKNYDGFTAPSAVEVTVLADGSATVEYKYTRNSYTITYYTVDAMDASEVFDTIEALYEAPVTAITATPVRTGYEFTGWDTVCPTAMPLDGMKITALWNPSTYDITYVGIYDGQTYPATHTFDTETALPNPERTGYTFAGWYYEDQLLGTEDVVIGKRQFSDDFTLTATWTANATQYTVETYLMDTHGNYPDTAASSETKDTVTDAEITASHVTMTGFFADTENSILTANAAHDGTSVLKLYYSRNQYDLTLESGVGIDSVNGSGTFYYQQSVTVDASVTAGYDWVNWTQGEKEASANKSYTFTMPAEAMTLTANASIHIYNINIDLANGSFADGYTAPTEYKVTDADIAIPNPTRTGYTFNGWNGTLTDYVIRSGSTGDVSLTAKWTPIEYKITYVLSNGTNHADNPDTYTVESSEITLQNPTRTGYEFIKWTEGNTIAAGSTGDKTFTAEWKALGVEYNIVYHFESISVEGNYDSYETGKGSAAADSTVTVADIAAEKTGFTFNDEKTVDSFKVGTTDGDTTVDLYYTRNSYTLTYDTDGGTEIAAQTYKYGANVTAPADPTKTGYTFAGWDAAVPDTMPAGDMTVTAQWNINQYTITFADTGDTVIDPITQDYNTAVTAPADPTKTGYTFAGWDVEIPEKMPAGDMTITARWNINQYTITFADTGDTVIDPITQDYATVVTAPADPTKIGYTFAGWDVAVPATMPAGDMTITAQWNINQYTITFNTDGGTAVDAITADFGTAVTAPADPTKTGYTFAGWDVAVPATMPAGDMTITAQWDINQYTITFDTVGGSTVNAITQDYNSAVTAPSDPTKPGYTFAGWTPAVPTVMPAANTTITATWEIVTYDISYTLNGGENNSANPSEYNVTQEVKLQAPTKVGYTFTGWQPSDTIGVGSTGNKTFTATWTPNTDTKFTVEYYIQPVDGSTELSAYTLHSDETKSGTSDTSVEVTPKDISGFKTPDKQTVYVNPDGSAVVKFYYIRNTYTVTFDTVGGSAISDINALYEAQITKPADPTKTGYTFKEWTPAVPETMPLNGLSVKAVWTANVYDIEYKGLENADTYAKTEKHTYGTPTVIADPSRAGYTFAGWKINDSAAAYTGLTLAADGYTDTITLEATWTADEQIYTVEYYFENIEGTEYVIDSAKTETGTAKTDSPVTLTPETAEGFALNTEMSELAATVPTDGSLVMKVYYDRQAYTLTWSIDGTTSAETLVYGQAVTYPADPTKEGYNFIGWTPANITTMPASDLTLTAQFAANTDTKYTVIHKLEDLNADTYTEKETETLYGTTDAEVTPSVKEYTGFTSPAMQTVTIKADGSTVVEYLYTRNSYEITVVAADAGLSNATATQTLEFGDTLNLTVTVADGYEFKGWTSSDTTLVADGATAEYAVTVPAGKVTMTANAEIIKYTISYDLVDGTVATANPTEYYVTTEDFTLNNPEKRGYTFLGWTGSNGDTAQTEVTVTKGTFGDLTYIANWSLNQYTITMHTDTDKTETLYYNVTSGDFTLIHPTKVGYTFEGWTGTDLTGTVKDVTVISGSVGDREYTAVWSANDNDCTVEHYQQNIYDDGYTLVESDTETSQVKTDATFSPDVKSYTGFKSPEQQSVLVKGDASVTVKYYYDREVYDVTLDNTDEGIASVSGAGTYRYGYEVTVNAVVKTGYTWKEWTDAVTSATVPAEQTYTFTLGAADVALKANTTLDEYTITYNGLDGSTGAGNNATVYTVNSADITLANPEKRGFTFLGWTGTDLSGASTTVTVPAGSTGDRVFTATWKTITYTITFDYADATTVPNNPSTYTVESYITVENPERVGYTFAGWKDANDASADPVLNIVLDGAIGDRSYVATWTANTDTEYTVEHYQMNLDGSYSQTATSSVIYNDGVSDGFVTPAVNTYEGFTSPEAQTVEVNPDGSTVVKYYYIRNQYTLTYVIAGSEDVVKTYYYGADLPEAPTATRDGYTFSAWDITTPATMPAKDLTITAQWNTVSYTVKFNANGGDAMADINYTIESAVTLPEAKRVGYTFNGWTVTYTDGTGNWATEIADNNAVLNAGLWGNVTLTANWTANSNTPYVVKHMFMNVDGTAYEVVKVEEQTATSDSLVTPAVLTGDDVIGFTSPEAQTVKVNPDGTTVVVYEYERNQYTLTWKIKGSADETVTYYYDAVVTAKADPVLLGHTFTGWSRSIPSNMPAENIEILANFNIITYTIDIDLNGGKTATENKTSYTVETETFTLVNPTRDGYTFLGWEGTDNGIDITVAQGSTGDRSYKATWQANAQIWYVDVYYMDINGAYSATPDKSIERSDVTDTAVSYDLADSLLDGFTADTANSVVTGTVPGSGTLRLTAKYIRNQYTMTFDAAGGSTVNSVTAYFDAPVAAPADPTRIGYTFNGWSPEVPAKMPYESKTHTALWTADSYTLTLIENGGTAVEDITYTIESADVLPAISGAGYFFEGWKVTAADGSWSLADANYAAGTPVNGKYGSATLTAQWTTVQYTLSFNTTHGTVTPASITYTVEDTANVLPTPVRPGYTFTGWKVTEVSDDSQSAGYIYWTVDQVYAAGTVLTNTYGNATFEAQWQENTYTVSADTENITFTGAEEATVDVDYTATLTPNAGYELPDSITVTVGGEEIYVGTGYTYTVNEDGTATLTIDGAYIIGDVKITAEREIITYTIGYDYANATYEPANPTSYNVETAVELLAPERTGYTFLGWTGSNGVTPETAVTIPVGTTGDKTYVANWEALPKQYTVEIYYMTTDGTFNAAPDKSWTVDSVTDANVSYDIYSAETLLTGFTANESISMLTGVVPAEGTLTLVAKYDRNKYALTVNGCDGVATAAGTVEYYYGKEIVADASVAMGYTWVEWQSADETVLAGSTDKKYVFNMPASAVTLTAVATLDTYNISYDLAGGELADGVTNPESYTVTTETFTLNNPTREGYIFLGWTGTDHGTATETVTVEKNTTTGDKSYTANWKAIEYTVSYDLAQGTATGNNPTVYTIENEQVTLSNPVRTGYTFLGWTGSNGTAPQTEVKIAGGTIGDLSFTANWSADAHTYKVEVRYMTTQGVYLDAADESETVTSETDALVSVTPNAPEGFTFDPNGSILSGTVDHEDKLVLKIYYSRNQYELKLADGGDGIDSVNTKTTTVYYGANVEISAAVSKGYTFEKWTSDNASVADSTSNPYTFTMPAGAVSLTATATLNTYNINYTMNDGTNDASNPDTYTVLDTVVLKQPARLGYTFTGWTGSYEGKDVTIAAGTTGEINLTANWVINTYKVSYNLDGGSVSGNPESYTVVDSFTLTNPTKVGYDFVGWAGTGIDGTQENVTVSVGTTGDLAFTAVWAARPDTNYTVNYYLENVNGDQTYTLSADSFVGEYYSDRDITPNVPVYTGFATPVAQTKTVKADGTTVFNFYYERNIYTYTFKAIGYEDAVYKYYYEYPVAKPSDPARAGYTFEGWNPVVFDKMPAYDVTSEAQWKVIAYSIGYDLAGGTVAGLNPTSYTVEDAFTLINPTKSGYTFVGWKGTGIDGTSLVVNIGAGFTGNRSYTAVWTPTQYAITYELDGGTDNGVNPISYNIEDSITLVNPTKVGYRFLGWTGTGVYGYSSYVTFSGSVGDRSYTAHWAPANDTVYTVKHYQQDIGANTYTLFEEESFTGTTLTTVSPNVKTYPGFTSPSRSSVEIKPDGSAVVEYYYTRNNYTIYFDANGGTEVASQTYAYGETIVAPADPSFLGYTFAGWTPALPETMTAGNLYVTADWKANSDTPYTVYHYYQDVDCVSYPEELMVVEYCHGETGAMVEVATRDSEGFTSPAKRTIVIAADGSRVVRYYYTRNTYTVTFVDHNDKILDMQSVVYGLAATPPVLEDRAPDADGHYEFIGWSEDTSFIHGYTTIKAMYSAQAHDPGPDATCTEALLCTDCGYEIAPANGHVPVVQTPAVDATCTTAGNTADSVCSVCGEVLSRYQIVPALGHEIGSWYVDVPATATSTGVLKRVCSRCDWYETHEIPVLSDTPVVSIDITTSGSQAYVGASYQLATSIMPANAANKQVIWESSDPSVASVTEDGYITSHKPGEVTFTVTTLDGLKTDSITINFYYSADHYNIVILDIFACELFLDGKQVEESVVDFIRVKAGSTLAFTLKPTTTEYDALGGYILTANGSNVEPDANGVYYIYNVHENIEITALPVVGEPEFDDNQQYDTDEVPEQSIFAKILAFFERIMEWFRNLFQ